MEAQSTHVITRLLERACAGDDEARSKLYGVLYAHLRARAAAYLRGHPAATLDPCALVHEAYMKLLERERVGFRDRGHFLAQAAKAMRWILTDHARARLRRKRGGDVATFPITEIAGPDGRHPVDTLVLHEALERFAEIDPQAAGIVELRFFGGLGMGEIAEATGLGLRTVEREWNAARVWLRGALR